MTVVDVDVFIWVLPESSIDLVTVAIVSVVDLQLYDDVRVVTVGGSDDLRHDFSGTSDVVVFVDVCFSPLPSIDTSTVSNVFVTVLQPCDDVRVVTVGGSDEVRYDFSGTSDVVVFVDVCFWPLPSIDTSTVSNVFVTVLQLCDDVRVVTVGGSDDVRHDFSGTSDVVVFVDVCFSPLPSIDTSTVSNV